MNKFFIIVIVYIVGMIISRYITYYYFLQDCKKENRYDWLSYCAAYHIRETRLVLCILWPALIIFLIFKSIVAVDEYFIKKINKL